jgi:2',3'-cyclic-nucleotide 2'-phosphodiesterase (5'-nucleotidase family)
MTNQNLTIIQLNDSHGYLELHNELFYQGSRHIFHQAGGFPRISGLIKNIRQENDGCVLALDCGDTIHGTYPAVQSKGEALAPILNEIGFDGWTAHWEFGYGPEQLKKVTDQLNYPLLAINCYDKETGERIFEPYRVIERCGLRIGVIGIAAVIVDKVMPDWFSKGIRMTLGNEELPGIIDQLKREEKVDLVLVMSHLGFPQEVKLAKEVEGIDILLSAHTHNRLYRPAMVNNTIIIQSGCHGSFLGRLDLTLTDGRILDYQHHLVHVDEGMEPDPAVEGLVENVMNPIRDHLSQKLGTVETPLHRYRVFESTMDTFLLQGLIHATGAEMAFSNGWRYGAPIPPGPITLNDLWNIIPVNPPVQTCDLTGAELWNMMEKNLERTFARNPYDQMGGYVKRCLGLSLYCKVENAAHHRIQELFIGDERVDMDRVYHVCYVTSQGVRKEYGTNRKKLDVKAVEVLRSYLEDKGRVSAELQGTINPI